MSKAILACSAVLAGSLLLTGCSSSDASSSSPQSPSSTAPEVVTNASVDVVTGRLDEAGQSDLSAQVTDLMTRYFDAAYLGDFPRSDFSAAFTEFTEGAAARAQDDLDLLTSAALSDQIDEATQTEGNLNLDILSPKNTPAGVTVRWTLDFTTTGTLESDQSVTGMFDLTPVDGAWKVFGYSIKGGPMVPLASAPTTPEITLDATTEATP